MSDLVPFDAPAMMVDCPLLHSMLQVNGFPSGSLIGIFQMRLMDWLMDPFPGVGFPKIGGRLVVGTVRVVKVYHLLVNSPLPDVSVALTQILYVDA